MATAPARPFNRDESQRRVRHPLQKVRGIIRRYVLVEGLCIAFLYLATWFWIGLALDYGLFALTSRFGSGFDYVWELNNSTSPTTSVALRVLVLAALTLGLVIVVSYKVFFRLFREFNDRALALLLERRFRRELGDRLITAVEMADPNLSKKYGFSQPMLDKTIEEAADRVERLPVEKVFRWGRLWFLRVAALLATVGVYLAVAVVTLVILLVLQSTAPVGGTFYGFNQTSSTWFERNLLMMDSYWPRRAQLELVRFPAGELRVALEENRPDVHLRAIKWVIADRAAPDGWRALKWTDLPNLPLPAEMLARINATIDPKDGGGANPPVPVDLPNQWGGWIIDMHDLDGRVPSTVIPEEWKWSGKTSGQIREALATPVVKAKLAEKLAAGTGATEAVESMLDWQTWTVDKLELQLNRNDVRGTLQAEHEQANEFMTELLTKLADLADQPSMGRTMRQLIVPKIVQVNYRGKTTKGSTPHDRQDNNKYSFGLNDLKEDVTFTVSAEDYSTSPRGVKLVPPPTVQPLLAHRMEPAYLHYRHLADPLALKDKRQHIRHQPIRTEGRDSSISVPLGSDLILTAFLDRDLKKNTAQVLAPAIVKDDGSITPQVVPKEEGPRSFAVHLQNITKVLKFDLAYQDLDGVKGRHHVVVRPVDDAGPTLSEIELASKLRPEFDAESAQPGRAAEGNRLLITPDAFLLFFGTLADDHALTKAVYRVEWQELEFILPGSEKEKGPVIVFKGDVASQRASLIANLFQYGPGSGYQWYAPAYTALLGSLGKEGGPKIATLKSGSATFPLKRFTQRYEQRYEQQGGDLPLDSIERLLPVNPRNRLDLANLLEARPTDDFVKDLEINYPRQAVLADLVALLKLDPTTMSRQLKDQPKDAFKTLLDDAGQKLEDKEIKLLRLTPEKVLQSLSKHTLDQERDFRDNQLVGGGFDLMAFLPKLKAADNETQAHYEVRVFVTATDNNIETGPNTAPERGPFVFKVISENELLVEVLKQRRKLYALFKESVDHLEGRKASFDAEVSKLNFSQPELGLAAIRADQMRKAARESGDIAKAVLDRYQGIVEELRVNRVREDEITTIERKITNPLASLLNRNIGEFDRTTSKLKELQEGLETDVKLLKQAEDNKTADAKLLDLLEFNRKGEHLPTAQEAGNRVRTLVRELRAVLEAMQDIEDDAKLIEVLVFIESQRRIQHQVLLNYQRELRRQLDEILNPPPKK